MSRGLNYACVNSSSHFNHSSYCVLFYLIVLYGCVCQPLINGYDDDDPLCNKDDNLGQFHAEISIVYTE